MNARTEKSKSVGFSIDDQETRHITIACTTKHTVTSYINLYSIAGEKYPIEGIEGITIKNFYQKGMRVRMGI